MSHMVQQKKEYFITIRVNLEMYTDISKLASIMEKGNISEFGRETFERMIKNARQKGIL